MILNPHLELLFFYFISSLYDGHNASAITIVNLWIIMFIFTAWMSPMYIHMPSTQTISLHYTLAAPLLRMAIPSQHTFSHVELNFVAMHVGVCVLIYLHLCHQLDQGS
jgi:hypothetical protein